MEVRQKRYCCKVKGFTLLEVIISVALVAILAGIGSFFSGNFFFSQETSLVREELQGSFAKAQIYSITGKDNASWGVAFRENERKIILFRGNTFDTRDQSRDEVYEIGSRITLSGFSEIVFARGTGDPSSEPTITVSGSGREYVLSLNSKGILLE